MQRAGVAPSQAYDHCLFQVQNSKRDQLKRLQRDSGFTLIELLVIIALLLTVGLIQQFVLSDNPLDVAVADFNGDGTDDVAVLLENQGLNVFFNDGQELGSPISAAIQEDVNAFAAGRLLKFLPGNQEILITVHDSGDAFYHYYYSGQLLSSSAIPTGVEFPSAVIVGQLNNDEYLDIVFGAGQGDTYFEVSVSFGLDDYGAMTPPIVIEADLPESPPGDGDGGGEQESGGSSSIRALALADLTGNGFLDIAASVDNGGGGSILIFENDEGEISPAVSVDLVGAGSPLGLTAGIFSNDEDRYDLAATQYSSSGKVQIIPNLGGLQFGTPQEIATLGYANGIVAIDLDGNDQHDLYAVGEFPGELAVLVQTDPGEFSEYSMDYENELLTKVAAGKVYTDVEAPIIIRNEYSQSGPGLMAHSVTVDDDPPPPCNDSPQFGIYAETNVGGGEDTQQAIPDRDHRTDIEIADPCPIDLGHAEPL